MSTRFECDAIEVKVRGFKSRGVGFKVAEALYSLGFRLKDLNDGSLPDGSMPPDGGLRESEIMWVDSLRADSLDEIIEELCFSPEIVVSHRQWAIAKNWASPTGEVETA